MRHSQIFLVSLAIALSLFLSGDTLIASAHGQSSGCQWHYVRHGETLSGIARMYGMSWQTLAQYNGLHNPNLIRAGSTLCIPSGYQGYQTYPSPSYGYKQPSYAPPSHQSHKYMSPGYQGYQTYPSPSYGYKQPSYAPPSHQSHKYMSPGYQAPGYQAPTYQAPGYQAPGYQAPSYQAPTDQAPGYQAPTYQAPGYQAPSDQAPPMATLPSGRMVVVHVSDFAFDPSTVTIHPGDMVVWRRTGGVHNVRADDGRFGNQASDSWTEFSQIFRAPGTVGYYCEIHGGPGGVGMAGMVIVQ